MGRHPNSTYRRWLLNQYLTVRSCLVYHWGLWDRRSNLSWRRRSHLFWLRLLHLVGWGDSSCNNFFLLLCLLSRIENLWSVGWRLVETLPSHYIPISNSVLDWDGWSSNWCLVNRIVNNRHLLILRHAQRLLLLQRGRRSLSSQGNLI